MKKYFFKNPPKSPFEKGGLLPSLQEKVRVDKTKHCFVRSQDKSCTCVGRFILLTLIKSYQRFISPPLPARCRYYPTCSEYGMQAIRWHGAKRGGWLTIKRICRCHPLGGHGIDFVPLPLYRLQFYYAPTLSHPYVYVDKRDYRHQLKRWINSHC